MRKILISAELMQNFKSALVNETPLSQAQNEKIFAKASEAVANLAALSNAFRDIDPEIANKKISV